MAGGIHQTLTDDPVSCEVVEAVNAGQLVEARTGANGASQRPVGVAGADSVKVFGVALIDADVFAASGSPLVVFPKPVATAVAVQGEVPNVLYSGTATYGAFLKVGASGAVVPWVKGTDDACLIVAKCVEPLGVTSGATGRIRLIGLC